MNQTRRGFFGLLAGGAAAAAAYDPEHALYVPGRRRIFIPPQRNSLVVTGWAGAGPGIKIGDTIRIRKPMRFVPLQNRYDLLTPFRIEYDSFIVTGIAESAADLSGSGLTKTLQSARVIPSR